MPSAASAARLPSRGGGVGEAQGEAGAALGCVSGLDGAAEQLGQAADDGQAEAGADGSEAAVALVQDGGFERDGEVVVGQARSTVAHLDDVGACLSAHLDDDGPAG